MNHEEATAFGKVFEDKIFPHRWLIMFPNTTLTPSTKYQNMECHFDFWWTRMKKGKQVDLKVETKAKTKGWGEYVLWELLNVNGYAGWGLGDADIIVFGAPDGMYVVNRKKVTNFICKHLNITPDIVSLRKQPSCLFDGAPLWKLSHRISRPKELTVKVPFDVFLDFVSKSTLKLYEENKNRFRY